MLCIFFKCFKPAFLVAAVTFNRALAGVFLGWLLNVLLLQYETKLNGIIKIILVSLATDFNFSKILVKLAPYLIVLTETSTIYFLENVSFVWNCFTGSILLDYH